jgi:hypothetical protein
MLVAAELTLAGIPAIKAPDNWPHYDVIAQAPDRNEPWRVSVKSRTFKKGQAFVSYVEEDMFDWLAIVILPGEAQMSRRLYLIPRETADLNARKNSASAINANERYWRIDEIAQAFGEFENNYALNPNFGVSPIWRAAFEKRRRRAH